MNTKLHYTWDTRPAYIPLTRKEVVLALSMAEFDAEQAAKILKVDTSRLVGFLRGHLDLNRQVTLKTLYQFISIRQSTDGIVITIKPDASFKRVTAGKSDHGFVITLDKVSREHEASVRKAQATLEGE